MYNMVKYHEKLAKETREKEEDAVGDAGLSSLREARPEAQPAVVPRRQLPLPATRSVLQVHGGAARDPSCLKSEFISNQKRLKS